MSNIVAWNRNGMDQIIVSDDSATDGRAQRPPLKKFSLCFKVYGRHNVKSTKNSSQKTVHIKTVLGKQESLYGEQAPVLCDKES